MKKLFVALSLLPMLSMPVAFAKTITCPTAKQANKIFNHCQIKVGKESCVANFQGIDIVLNSTTEGLYGGTHLFKGFKRFNRVEILSHYFVCKYSLVKGSKKMAWVIGSRYALPKNCRLLNAKKTQHLQVCQSHDPSRCKIVCE